MKLFFDMKGFVFVVGLDRQIVELSIEGKLRNLHSSGPDLNTVSTATILTGANYIKKIFQVPYALAPVSASQIEEFLFSIQQAAGLQKDQWQEIDRHVKPNLRFLIDESGMNPREVKRFINAYTIQRKIKPNLDKDIILALQTISFRPDWNSVNFAILGFRRAFIDALKRHAKEPHQRHLETLDPELAHVPQSFYIYIGPGNPGQVLTEKNFEIDEYLYSGEATRTSESAPFVKLFGDLTSLKVTVEKAFDGELDFEAAASTAQEILSKLRSTFQGGTFPGQRVGLEISATVRSLQKNDLPELFSRSEATPGSDVGFEDRGRITREVEEAATKLAGRREETIGHIHKAITFLREIYQAGSL